MDLIEAKMTLTWLRGEAKIIKQQLRMIKGGRTKSPKKELYAYLQKLELNLYSLQTAIKTGQIE